LGHLQNIADPQTGDLVQLQGRPLLRLFSTVALLLASQLSFLIYSYRSKSRKDFKGRYRIWAWAAAFWGAACLSFATGIHHPLARFAYGRWEVNCWRPEVSYWMAPFGVGLLAVYRLVARDLRQCRISRLAWGLTFGLALTAGALHLGAEMLVRPEWRSPVVAGVTTFWHLALVVALLIHARFVAHVTNEAGPKSFSIWSHAGRWITRQLMEFGAWVISRGQMLITALRRVRVTTAPSAGSEETVTGRSKSRAENSAKPKRTSTATRKASKSEVVTTTEPVVAAVVAVTAPVSKAGPEQQKGRRWWSLRGWQRSNTTEPSDSPASNQKQRSVKSVSSNPPAARDDVTTNEAHLPAKKPVAPVKSSGNLTKRTVNSSGESIRVDEAVAKTSRVPAPHLTHASTAATVVSAPAHQRHDDDDERDDNGSSHASLSKKERKRLKQMQRESRRNR
jgi:hypothetical protein